MRRNSNIVMGGSSNDVESNGGFGADWHPALGNSVEPSAENRRRVVAIDGLERDFSWLDPKTPVRFPKIETGRSFPLSFLVFLFTLTSFFFGFWRISPGAGFGILCLLTPGLMRTMWVVESRRLNGEATSFSEQSMIWLVTSIQISGALVLGVAAFLISFGLIACAGAVAGGWFLGNDGSERGLVMGVVIGVPLGCSAGLMVIATIFTKSWGRDLSGPIDVRN